LNVGLSAVLKEKVKELEELFPENGLDMELTLYVRVGKKIEEE